MPFVFLFDTKAECVRDVGVEDEKYFSIGHVFAGSYLRIEVGLTIFATGSVHYGYYKNNKKHYFGQYIAKNGD